MKGMLVEYALERWINQTVHAHPLLSGVVVEFASWGVTVFGALGSACGSCRVVRDRRVHAGLFSTADRLQHLRTDPRS